MTKSSGPRTEPWGTPQDDDSAINREIKTLFTLTNVLRRRFRRCSLAVKVRLFVPSVCFMMLPYGLILLLVS